MMTRAISVLTVALAVLLAPPPGSATVKKSETIRKTFSVRAKGAGTRVVVDNVWGSITVEGTSGDELTLVAKKTVRADSKKEYQMALDEVVLEITEDEALLEFFVDGPFRCGQDGRRKGRRWRERDYVVEYEFELKVPRGVELELSTVNDGDIRVRDVLGDFEVNNVNGGIDMSGLRGSGEAYSVNGDVRLRFEQNPRSDCRFGALNGEVRVYFTSDLSADFHLKTFNGEVFTDFPVTRLPDLTFTEVEKKDGSVCKKMEQIPAVRAGEGGPVIKLDGFNGDMFILKRT
jgi:hypothetical protein